MTKFHLFLDSGAFSAFTLGETIELPKYMKYIQESETIFDAYCNLDVIGDPKACWDNQHIMEQEGLKPLPVFHSFDAGPNFDDMTLLYKCLDYEYFALGGMASGFSEKERKRFLHNCWNVICDKDGNPRSKVHGFGLTSAHLFQEYPWYSVDSSSWIKMSGFGNLMAPKLKGGKWDYTDAMIICVSYRSPMLREAGRHYNNYTPAERAIIDRYIHEVLQMEVGESEVITVDSTHKLKDNEKQIRAVTDDQFEVEVIGVSGIRNDYRLRLKANSIYYYNLAHQMRKFPWSYKTDTLVGKRMRPLGKMEPDNLPMRQFKSYPPLIYLAGTMSRTFESDFLNYWVDMGASPVNRLVSFHYLDGANAVVDLVLEKEQDERRKQEVGRDSEVSAAGSG